MTEIVLQNIAFPKNGVCNCEELYYRKIGLPSSRDIFRDTIIFKKNQRVAFDTYYNSLSLLKWTKYTYADSNFSLKLQLKGNFLISLVHMFIKPDGVFEYKTLVQHTVNTKEVADFKFPYITDNPWGCLTFCVEGLENGSVFYSAQYVSNISDAVRNIKIGIGICTFKRETYVKNNMKNLCKSIFDSKTSELNGKVEVFISDNANTLLDTDFNSDKIHLFANKNTGGSGGFTRCMIEVNNANENGGEFTHILLMDDDIIFDTESIARTYKILTLCKPEYIDAFVGGAMFRMDSPNIQHASGERWHGKRCESFIETFNHNKNMTEIISIIENEFYTPSNYQAWWFCAIPLSICNKDNLSMPFFIKSDDIEYSLRNLKTLILLNGINVWHESFESKYSATNEYYTVRNYLVTASIYEPNLKKDDIVRLLDNYTKHYVCNYKYYELEHLCNAINDYLNGVDNLKSIDIAEFHKELMKKQYKMLDASELPIDVSDEQYYKDISFEPNWTNKRKHLAKISINGLLLPAKGYSVLGMWGGTYAQTYRKKFLIRYEINTKKAFILERSLSKFLFVFKLYKKTRKRIINGFDMAKREYIERHKELFTLDLWKTKL